MQAAWAQMAMFLSYVGILAGLVDFGAGLVDFGAGLVEYWGWSG